MSTYCWPVPQHACESQVGIIHAESWFLKRPMCYTWRVLRGKVRVELEVELEVR